MKPAAKHFTAFLFLLSAGCDPGYRYFPVNDAGDKIESPHHNIDGASISCPGFVELTGSRSVHQTFEVSNETDLPVVLQAATLVLDTKRIEGATPADGDLTWRSIPSKTTGQIRVSFDLSDAGGYVGDALGATIKYDCDFEIDGKTEKLEWRLVRADHVPKTK